MPLERKTPMSRTSNKAASSRRSRAAVEQILYALLVKNLISLMSLVQNVGFTPFMHLDVGENEYLKCGLDFLNRVKISRLLERR